MNHCLSVASVPGVIFLISETMSGHFEGYRWLGWTLPEVGVAVIAVVCFLGHIPLSFWVDYVGTKKIRDYLSRNGQILERQLMGALARLFRTSQLYRIHFLAVGTFTGLVDAAVARSSLGLVVYLTGQALLIYFLPWPARWELWQTIRRKLILD
jgi:hypothetical protein